MKSSNIGGQAVLEGIMMRNGSKYSVAVRRPDGEIAVDVKDYKSVIPWKTPLKIPFIRGIFSFVDSLVLGMRTLTYSASFFEDEEEEILTEAEAAKREKQEKIFFESYGSCSCSSCRSNFYGTAILSEQYCGAIHVFQSSYDSI